MLNESQPVGTLLRVGASKIPTSKCAGLQGGVQAARVLFPLRSHTPGDRDSDFERLF